VTQWIYHDKYSLVRAWQEISLRDVTLYPPVVLSITVIVCQSTFSGCTCSLGPYCWIQHNTNRFIFVSLPDDYPKVGAKEIIFQPPLSSLSKSEMAEQRAHTPQPLLDQVCVWHNTEHHFRAQRKDVRLAGGVNPRRNDNISLPRIRPVDGTNHVSLRIDETNQVPGTFDGTPARAYFVETEINIHKGYHFH